MVEGTTYVRISVGAFAAFERAWDGEWYPVHATSAPLADWAECVRLMAAADGGTR